MWGWVTYDPDADLIYYGTSNPGPWNAAQRDGLSGTERTQLKYNSQTGHAVWSATQGDRTWRYDGLTCDALDDP